MNKLYALIIIFFGLSVAGYTQNHEKDSLYGLLDKVEKQLYESPEKSVALLQKLRKHIRTGEALEPKYYYLEAYANFNLGNIQTAQKYCDSVLSATANNSKITAETYSLLSIIYRKKGKLNKAVDYINRAIDMYQKTNNTDGLNNAYLNLGKIYNMSGENQKALSLFLKALSYYKSQNNDFKQGQVLSIIANVYTEIDEKEKGKQYALEGIELLKKYPHSITYGDALNNFGIFLYDEKDYSKAAQYFEQALKVYQAVNIRDAVAVAEQNLGISHIHLKHFKKGFRSLHHSLKIFQELHINDEISVLTDLGTAHQIARNIDSAKYYFRLAYKLADRENYTYYKKENLRLLYQLFEKNKDYTQAFHYYKLYTNYRDSLNNDALKHTIAELEIKYKTSEKEKEIFYLKSREQINKANNRLLIIGIISVIIISFITVSIIQTRRKKEKEIQHQQLIIQQKEEELLKNKLKKIELEDQKLKQELEFKTKQLTTHTLNMMQKNKLLQTVAQEISLNATHSKAKNKNELLRIQRKLEHAIKADKDWDLFKIYFEQINKSFFTKLKNINPKLTANDYRLCALLKLNMSIKEMAGVLGISSASVKNAKYRLKKKLNIDTSQDLKEFIVNL